MSNVPQKIISLLPAATEIVCALGLKENLVGISHECDYPEGIKNLPICSRAFITNEISSMEIDREVKEILSDALSIYTINKELIKQLNPDVIITQALCAACGVSLPDVEQALKDLLDTKTHVISLQPGTLGDILNDIRIVADKLGVSNAGDVLLDDMLERIDIVRHKLKFLNDKPTVACIEWMEPLMLSGNWMPELVTIAGGQSILAQSGKHSPYVSWAAIQSADPDILIVMPCGFAIERTLNQINELLLLPYFANLKAIKNNRLYIADGNQYFNRPGPRIVDSIEILAEIINPKQFVFGYEGEGWIKFTV